MSEEQKKGVDSVKAEVIKTWYGFCRIPNGLKIDFVIDGEKKHVIFKSGFVKSLAGDGQTLTFQKKDDYGITEITEEQMKLCKKEVEKSGIYKKGFIFFAESVTEGQNLAKQYLKLHSTTGFERLTTADIEKIVQQFKKD